MVAGLESLTINDGLTNPLLARHLLAHVRPAVLTQTLGVEGGYLRVDSVVRRLWARGRIVSLLNLQYHQMFLLVWVLCQIRQESCPLLREDQVIIVGLLLIIHPRHIIGYCYLPFIA